MKRYIALILAFGLLVGFVPMALAEDVPADRLAEVAALVLETLGLSVDEYDEFSGDSYEGILYRVWNLTWSSEWGSLEISVRDDGKILRVSQYDSRDYESVQGHYLPKPPAGSRDTARAGAEVFLACVLTDGESAELQDVNDSLPLAFPLYSFSGTLLLNGLPTPFGFSISARGDGSGVSFYRGDNDFTGQYVGGIPAPDAEGTAEAARALLRETISLRLEYVWDGDGTAQLRYLPESTDNYFVDGETGALVNISDIYRGLGFPGSGPSVGMPHTAPAYGPQWRELGIYPSGERHSDPPAAQGTKSTDALDKLARGRYPHLKLDGYTLTDASYENDQNGNTACILAYSRTVGEDEQLRFLVLDAVTGTLLYVSSFPMKYRSEWELTVDVETARRAALAFFAAAFPEKAGEFDVYSSFDALGADAYFTNHIFQLARVKDGYFYPGDSYTIDVDAVDGAVCYLTGYDNNTTLGDADGVISYDDAVDAYLTTFDSPLTYLAVPLAIDPDDPAHAPFRDLGYGYVYALRLGYALKAEVQAYGIDAKTGEPVCDTDQSRPAAGYGDIDGHWAQAEIAALAEYNVGFWGGSFLPAKELTQVEAVALLTSAAGYSVSFDSAFIVDIAYDYAYGVGFLAPDARDDTAQVTRLDFVRMLLDGAGYAAGTGDDCPFADALGIPAEYRSYASHAYDMGFVQGDGSGNFVPNRVATRAEAAVILYRFLNRAD